MKTDGRDGGELQPPLQRVGGAAQKLTQFSSGLSRPFIERGIANLNDPFNPRVRTAHHTIQPPETHWPPFELPAGARGWLLERSAPLLLQFANFEQYFDKNSMDHYAAGASDPHKVLYYDTGHDLNDPKALEDRYDWLAKEIDLKREPIIPSSR